MGTCCSSGQKTPAATGDGGAALDAPVASATGVASQGKLLEKYTLGKVLGQGAFGIVYSCREKSTKTEYAVKMIDKVETPIAEIRQEAEMLKKLEHTTVVKLRDVYYEKAFVCMVMDVYKGGDMIEGMQLHWKQIGMLPISVVANVSKQMIESIAWLHHKMVVHRDVKGDNYLMDRKDIEHPKCRIYLSDFGTVRDLKEGERLTSKCGTKTYWSPEFYAQNYAHKVDVWAIGVVMYGLVTGRFPFKGLEDVQNKKVQAPPRSSKACGDLLKKLLEKKESDRVSAGKAKEHPFVATTSTADKEAPVKMDFTPDVKEGGANAGIAERRRELVGRLEDAQAPREGKSAPAMTLQQLKDNPSFQVEDHRAEKVTHFAWYSEAQARQLNLVDYDNARPVREEDDAKNDADAMDSIRQMLESHNIATGVFGTGQAKKFDEFFYEVQSGASRLMLDATKHKSVVRVVDVVLLRVIYKTDKTTRYLIHIQELFPDNRTRTDIYQLPGTKKEPHENSRQTALRIVNDRLNLTQYKIKFDFTKCETFEDEENSPSYPGVRTVYRKEIYEGQIMTTDAGMLETIGVQGDEGGFKHQDSKKYVRTFHWLDEKECIDKQVKLKALQESTEISALVHAPVGIGEEDLKEFLQANDVDVSKFGQDDNKSLKDFSDELVKGEAALAKQKSGRIIRVVDVVILMIWRGGELLVEVNETVKGKMKVLNWLPAVKRRPDENMFLAAHRVIAKVLKINDNFITLNQKDVLLAEEEKKSTAYCGLPTVYRKRIISAEVLGIDCINL